MTLFYVMGTSFRKSYGSRRMGERNHSLLPCFKCLYTSPGLNEIIKLEIKRWKSTWIIRARRLWLVSKKWEALIYRKGGEFIELITNNLCFLMSINCFNLKGQCRINKIVFIQYWQIDKEDVYIAYKYLLLIILNFEVFLQNERRIINEKIV